MAVVGRSIGPATSRLDNVNIGQGKMGWNNRLQLPITKWARYIIRFEFEVRSKKGCVVNDADICQNLRQAEISIRRAGRLFRNDHLSMARRLGRLRYSHGVLK